MKKSLGILSIMFLLLLAPFYFPNTGNCEIWTQIGDRIYDSFYGDIHISLSADGTIMAFGAYYVNRKLRLCPDL